MTEKYHPLVPALEELIETASRYRLHSKTLKDARTFLTRAEHAHIKVDQELALMVFGLSIEIPTLFDKQISRQSEE